MFVHLHVELFTEPFCSIDNYCKLQKQGDLQNKHTI